MRRTLVAVVFVAVAGVAGALAYSALANEREFERLIPELAITPDVWNDACDLARRCRAAGVSVPATDVLISACARHYGARLEHADSDFDLIDKAAG